jgi:site-specific DNA-methyltransferase (adenine-specific)
MDALQFLELLKPNIADIVFIDPPFNLGKIYGSRGRHADRLADDAYLEFMRAVLQRASRILKPGGALYLYHLPRWALVLANDLLAQDLTFRHWIAVTMKNGFVRGMRLYPAHYALLYFTKGEPAYFSRPKLQPKQCRHCQKLLKDYGGYARFIKDGLNLSDVWDDLSPVRHKKHKTRLSNELPPELTRRVVAISGPSSGVLVDPFAGTGSSGTAARESGLSFLLCDAEPAFCDLMRARLDGIPTIH